MSKVFLGIITQNEIENIRELTTVWNEFDGIVATDHFSTDSTADLLKARMKEGSVEQIEYRGHHAHSMNNFLFSPKVSVGDWILLRDSSERVAEPFAKDIHNFVAAMEVHGISSIYQYSKLLLFRRFPHQFFYSTPHWGFQGAQQKAIQIDQMNWFKKDEEYCYSVRNKNRNSRHFVGAYLRYYLLLDSNHPQLGMDKAEAAGVTYQDREGRRVSFRQYLKDKGVSIDTAGVLKLLELALDDKGKEFFNKEKILNDFYRENILKDSNFPDNHDHKNLVEIK